MSSLAIPFQTAQLRELATLLDLSPAEQPTADKILSAMREAIAVNKAYDRELSLTRTSSTRKNPLIADARRRASEAILTRRKY
jgi:hypothetical protein